MVLKPGVDTEKTATLAEGQIHACNLIRWFGGLPEKCGGWSAYPSMPAFVGTCRGLFGFGAFDGSAYLAVGTDQRLYVNNGGNLDDITPLVDTTNGAPNFSTVIGTPTVTIIDVTAVATPTAGDWIHLPTMVSVGGLVLQGYYQVVSIVGANQYTITAASNALSTVNNGGTVPLFTTVNASSTVTLTLLAHHLTLGQLFTIGVSTTVATVVISGLYAVASVPGVNSVTFVALTPANANASGSENAGNSRIEYLLPSGYAVNTPAGGWGAGNWGAGDWGGTNASVLDLALRYWSLDHWGEDLIASPRNGGIYSWSPPNPTPAIVVPNAPDENIAVFALAQAQIIIALGAELLGTQYPTLVRWCDSGDRTAWTATATNQAGSFQLPSGSTIVAGLTIGMGALIWTDADLWSMTYQGLPFIFGFNRIAVNCEALSAKAPVVVGNSVVWPSDKGFFRYDGSQVAPLDCTVWSFMFNNLDTTQSDQVCSALNTLFDEVAWFFPIDPSSPIYSATAPIGFCKWNFAENLWDYGQSSQYQRTAWVDHSPVGNPIGADTAGLLQQHEISSDANGAPMVWFWRTGYFDLGDGGEYMRLDRIDPDFLPQALPGETPLTKLTVYGQDFPNDTPSVYGPLTVSQSTPMTNWNLRHRQAALEVGGDTMGGGQRLGALRLRIAPTGRR